jgi:hypothetical protein
MRRHEGNHEKARVELFSAIALREGIELRIESVAADIIVVRWRRRRQ